MSASPNRHPKRLMKVPEVADLFDVHPDTVREWARTGRLSCIKTPGGQEYRFLSTSVEALLGELVHTPTPTSPAGAGTPAGL